MKKKIEEANNYFNFSRWNNNNLLAKGSVYVLIGKLIYFLSGYIIHIGLVRIIDPIQYGTLGVILSILTVIQIFFIQGVPNSVAKYLSNGYDGKEIMKKSIILQLSYTFFIAFFIIMLSPFISEILNDKTITAYIRFIAIIVMIRGLVCLLGGFFVGYRRFREQSYMEIIMSLARVFFVFLLLYIGFGLYGILFAYAISSIIGIIYFFFSVHIERTSKFVTYRKIIGFSYPIIFHSFLFHFITSMDLFFIKASSIPENYVGYYTSARVLSTFFIIIAATFSLTLFPSISKSFSSGNKENTESYIKTSLRYILLLFIPVAVIISITSKELLSLFFTEQYAQAGVALSILIWGWFFLQLFYVFASIINASGKSKIPAFITGTAVVVAWFSNHYLVNHYGIEGGATATLITGIVCFTGGLFYVHKIFKVSININSTIKIIASSLVILLVSLSVHVEGILVVGWCVFLFSIYLGILFLIREIKKEDLILVNDIFRGFFNNRTR